ncbi:hypothetical protein KL914_003933 [Ogataea haglerorum]|uniref:Uncharacterized protein n=1 Tax=Ogataea haglerorum TaxID=1937702 RepID=A0ABQ7RC98_9ASCO|nr:hypothetical protein KL914_003933 [Ogataea haglerorum]KAG7763109.1 hypothetical protein KL946_003925 [Ogataea haglerorum]
MHPLKDSKYSISYILDTTVIDSDTSTTHSLGVNSLQYDVDREILFSGGRDGMILMHFPTEELKLDPDYDDFDQLNLTAPEVKSFIKNNLTNEPVIMSLEESIRRGMDHIRPQKSCYKMKKSAQMHLDWITDMCVLPQTSLVASCSHDSAVRLWNYETNVISTVGFHNDYVKTMDFNKKELVSGGLDRSIRLWDIAKQEESAFFTSTEENRSVYALACHGNMIVSGGPSQTIYLFDKRTMIKPVRSFIGHTDAVRSLCLKDRGILSGSSDATIKLWDLRTNRIMRNLDIHESSVWSLYVPKEQSDFDIFYSGDKNGLLMKTDLRSSNLSDFDIFNENYLNSRMNQSLGIATTVADLNSYSGMSSNRNEQFDKAGVLSITGSSNSIWASSATSDLGFITDWTIPKTDKLLLYQGIKLNRNLSMLNMTNRNSIETTRAENLDIASQFSSESLDYIDDALKSQMKLHRPTFEVGGSLSASGLRNLTVNDSETESEVDDGRESYFVNLNGGPSFEFITNDDYEDPIHNTIRNNFEKKPLDIVFQRLPDGYVSVVPYNSRPIEVLRGKHGIIKCRMLNNRRHVAALDDGGKMYIFDVIDCSLKKEIHLSDHGNKSTEMDIDTQFDHFIQNIQTMESLPMWCSAHAKAGKLVITMEESDFASCDIYLDEFETEYRNFRFDYDENSDPESTKLNVGKLVLKSLFLGFADYEKESLKTRNANLSCNQSGIRRTSTASSNVLSKVINKENLVSLASVNDSIGEKSSDNDKEKAKRKFFGKYKAASSSTASASNNEESSAEQMKNLTEADILPNLNSYSELQNYIATGQLKPKIVIDHNPEVSQSNDVLIVISEKGMTETKALFSSRKSEIESCYPILEKVMPLWALKYLLFGYAAVKDTPKIVFLIVPHPSINAESLEGFDSHRLNAYQQLRIARVCEFVREKLPESLQEKRIQLWCKGQKLDPRMTLLTVKTRIWRTSADTELVFSFED